MSLIFDGKKYAVRFFQGADDSRIIISFSSWREQQTLDEAAFGEGYCIRHNLTAITIRAAENDWYQAGEFSEALAVIDRVAGDRFRIGYGSSMGAYAAINFADILKLDRVIAFCPQFSIHRQKVPWEDRWKIEAERISFIRDRIHEVDDSACDIIIFFDPNCIDRLHVKKIKKHVSARSVKVRYGGHHLAIWMNENGILGKSVKPLLVSGERRMKISYINELIASVGEPAES